MGKFLWIFFYLEIICKQHTTKSLNVSPMCFDEFIMAATLCQEQAWKFAIHD